MLQGSAISRLHQLSHHLPIDAAGVRIRQLETRDAPRYSLGASDAETERWAYMPGADNSPDAVRQRIEGQYHEDAENGRAVRLAIADTDTDDYLGLMAFFDDRGDSVEIGFVITPDSRGRGVTGRALAATERLAEWAGYSSLRARTHVGNQAAHRTLRSAGYAPEGEPAPPVTEGLDDVRLQLYTKRLPGHAGTGLQELLEQKLLETGVPGAQAAIIHRGTTYRAAAGVLNVRTGFGVTHESIFQIGSITKLFTTVLVLQLVDDGLVRLDDAVVDHVPEFRLTDRELAAEVRIIDLLQHRGGFDGDVFTDGGRGSDANQKLIAELVHSEIFHHPGEQFAYSNAGMVVLGRLVELKRDADYLRVVRERIYEPLGLEHAATLPEEAILHAVAVGHTRDEHGEPMTMPSWQLPMSAAATGAVLTMSAGELARFGETLLAEGVARNGVRLLSPETARLMGQRAFSLPVASIVGEGFGTGALTYRYEGATAFGHDGQSIGQVSGLRVMPGADLVVAVTTNRENTSELTEAVIDFALRHFADAHVIPEPQLPEVPLAIDEKLITGFYSNSTMTATVTVEDGEARLRIGARSIDLGNQPAMRLYRVGEGVHRIVASENGVDLKFLFTDTDGDGVADFLWFNRLLRREDPR